MDLANRALQFRVARVSEGLREPHDGRGAAMGGLGHLMGRDQRQLGEVIHEVPGEGLLGRAEPLVVAAEDLGEFGDVGWHVRLIRRAGALPFPGAPTIGA